MASTNPVCPSDPNDIPNLPTACERFFCSQGMNLNVETASSVQQSIYSSGIGCINAYLGRCGTFCKDLTKSPEACYSCLAQTDSCPDRRCQNQPIDCALSANANDPCCKPSNGCCPFAQDAVACGVCAANKAGSAGQTLDIFKSCAQSNELSRTNTVIIAVVCSVVGVIIITIIIVAVKLRKSARQRQALMSDLRQKGVNEKVVQQIGKLDFSKINYKVFKDVDVNLLKQSGRKAVPAKATSAAQLTNETDGLFAM